MGTVIGWVRVRSFMDIVVNIAVDLDQEDTSFDTRPLPILDV